MERGKHLFRGEVYPNQYMFIESAYVYHGVLHSSPWGAQENGHCEVQVLLERHGGRILRNQVVNFLV
jgi:hypothetical protein